MPVASTTITPGRPCANRAYQSITSLVTKPSSVARHGTIAGTHVRVRASRGPITSGWNKRASAACSAVGHVPGGSSYLIRSAGCHIASNSYHELLEQAERVRAVAHQQILGLLIVIEDELVGLAPE